ncbi:MAG: hydroxyacid dehydrogenase [Bacteroidia bacterium]|nr:hydroxyacid dehydrogenase [Bacteroidia bacterium]
MKFLNIKILITDEVHPKLYKLLTAEGFEIFDAVNIPAGKIGDIIFQYHGLIIRSRINITCSLIDKAINLKFIARLGSGLENIDVEYACRKGIVCINSPEASRDAVGERTLGLLLALLNHICKANHEIKNGIWDRKGNWGNEIRGKTVGIIGYGNMGSAFAKKLKGFNTSVISYDKYKKGYSDGNTTEVCMDKIFSETDILSLHIPLTEETTGLVNDSYIKKFRKPFYLINTSRGKIVNTRSLASGLQQLKILGAALDVLEYENSSFEKLHRRHLPAEYDKLIKSEQVILSPHVAGWTYESYEKHAEVIFRKIKELYTNYSFCSIYFR